MSIESTKGFYIEGTAGITPQGGTFIPTGVLLVYGTPVIREFDPFDIVRPVEKRHLLLRELKRKDIIYVRRMNPQDNYTEFFRKDGDIEIPITPELLRVFDYYVPIDMREKERFARENHAVFAEAMKKAGYTQEYSDRLLDENGSEWWNTKFHPRVVAHIEKIPEPTLVRVEGIEGILNELDQKQL